MDGEVTAIMKPNDNVVIMEIKSNSIEIDSFFIYYTKFRIVLDLNLQFGNRTDNLRIPTDHFGIRTDHLRNEFL